MKNNLKRLFLTLLSLLLLLSSSSKALAQTEDCGILSTVSRNPDGTYNLGVSVNDSLLDDSKNYRLVLNTGSLALNTNLLNDVNLTFSPKDSGPNGFNAALQLGNYEGQTYELYVIPYDAYFDLLTPGASAICNSNVYFDPEAPLAGIDPNDVQDASNPTEAESDAFLTNRNATPNDGDPIANKVFCPGQTEINTALGCISTNPTQFTANILRLAVGIGGGIALLLMLYGFFAITTSAGNPDKVKAGQEVITSAIGGLLFIIFSVILMQLIGVQIFAIPGL